MGILGVHSIRGRIQERCGVSSELSAVERSQLAQDIQTAILETINQKGYRGDVAVQAAESAAKMVAQRVQGRKPKGPKR